MLFDRSCEIDSLSATMEREGSLGIANVATLGPGDLDKIADAMQDQLLYESGLVQDLVHNLSA
jgi:hypothetical protein